MLGMLQTEMTTAIQPDAGTVTLYGGAIAGMVVVVQALVDLLKTAITKPKEKDQNGMARKIHDLSRDHKDLCNKADRIEMGQRDMERLLQEQNKTQLLLSQTLERLAKFIEGRE